MKNKSFQVDGYMNALRFISGSMSNYGFANDVLSEVSASESELIFVSRDFLKKKQWSVIPLWEANLKTLSLENGVHIEFMNLIKSHCLRANCRQLNYATIDKMEKWWYSDFSRFVITNKEIDLFFEDPNQFFSIRDPDHLPPYRGNNIFWPESEEFVVYTDGDNLAFMAGNKNEIEGLLGVSYQYCLSRFIDVNGAQIIKPALLRALEIFCDEHTR